MEPEEVHSEAVESEELIKNETESSYTIIRFRGNEVPSRFEPLLFSRWLRSLRFGNGSYKKVKQKVYYEKYHQFIEMLLSKPSSLVSFAVLSDDHDVVLGFCVSREDVIDYIHVHTDYRRIGIGKKLMPKGATTFSHLTATAIVIWQGNEKYKHLNFNPFA